ncbi:hypothetical protein [Nitrosomonas sp. Nm34]|uniref:hypothetical protein n=1 Tax=Nitrosomonas sp. Nm34 TaxID=1881055 RepID=UPI0008E77DF7|nr:hypothetical protein [Nitrosomonas sp. Nm34]SFI75200.1 hypothetical protein SAMN05428978_103238 [Nitrosomonas sp. Nm34]
MEEIYLVHAEAVAAKTAINADDIDIVDAIIFVSAKSQDEARALASAALMEHSYHLIRVFSVSVPTLSAVLMSDTHLIAQYHAAVELGYSLEIMAHPRDERHPDHPFESRTLISPIFYQPKNH